MSTRLFVGNLSYKATDADLRNHFSSVGAVNDAKVIMERESGRSRGFGFVEMADEVDAQEVISKLNQSDLLGRNINVSVAQARPERAPRGNSF